MDLLVLIIPLVVPVLIAAAKHYLPRLPKWSLPIIAPLLGAGAQIVGHYAGVFAGDPVLGAVLGAAGVGLREIVDQVRKAASA